VVKRQNELCDLNIIPVICGIISSGRFNEAVKDEVIKLIISMTVGGNKKVQDAIFEYMVDDLGNSFLLEIQSQMQSHFRKIK
jgi:hypothetical protein